MIQFLELNNLSASELRRLLRRAETDIENLFPIAQDVINQIRTGGDAAVVKYIRQFDAPDFEVYDERFKGDADDSECDLYVAVN